MKIYRIYTLHAACYLTLCNMQNYQNIVLMSHCNAKTILLLPSETCNLAGSMHSRVSHPNCFINPVQHIHHFRIDIPQMPLTIARSPSVTQISLHSRSTSRTLAEQDDGAPPVNCKFLEPACFS